MSLAATSPRVAATHTLAGATMGTGWSVRLSGVDGHRLPELRLAIEQVFADVIAQMSTWEPDSDLARFNRADAGSWLKLPAGCRHVLGRALAWAEASGGAFDPTVGPLVNLWGFGPGAECSSPPASDALGAARARVGWQRIQLDSAGRVRQPGDCHLDFSGIAKGYAVDRVVDTLAQIGIEHMLVEIGGELKARGHNADGQPWQIAVKLPGFADGEGPVLKLDGIAVATSGDDFNYFESGGVRFSHTIDPRTGAPVKHALASVTVLHADAIEADAIATALTVLGPDAGVRWARERKLAALFVARDGDDHIAHPTPDFLAALS